MPKKVPKGEHLESDRQNKLAICTIIAKNYLSFARVLTDSLLKHNPEVQVFVLLVDRVDEYFNPELEKFQLVTVEELEYPQVVQILSRYSAMEACTAVKPYFLEYLLERYNIHKLAYFDPDILITDNIDELWQLLDTYSIILTPHITEAIPLEKENEWQELTVLRTGTYNLGFIGLARNQTVIAFLKWWQERLYKMCVWEDPSGTLFLDQKWINFVPGLFDGVFTLRDPGYNVAYWNLQSRRVECTDGKFMVNGRPLKFFHFSGLEPQNIEQISKYQNIFTLKTQMDLKPLFEQYRELLLVNGYLETTNWPYALRRSVQWNQSLVIRGWLFIKRVIRKPVQKTFGKNRRVMQALISISHRGDRLLNRGRENPYTSIPSVTVDMATPARTRRELLVKLAFRFLKSPRPFLANVSPRNIKAFLFYLRTTNVGALEHMVDVKLRTDRPETGTEIVTFGPNLAEESVRQKKMVILMVDDKVPEYDKYAGALTTYQYTRLLHSMGFTVVFLPDDLQKREPYVSEMERSGINVICDKRFTFDSWIQTNGSYITVAWLSRPHVAAKYMDKLKKHSHAQILYYTMDLHYLRLERQYEVDGNANVLREARYLKKLESSIFSKSDIILTPSDTERDIISNAFPAKHVESIPGWIFKHLPAEEIEAPYEHRKDIVFLGGFGHPPNADAVLWFVNEIFPHISHELPKVRFFIIGTDPPEDIKALASTSIVVTGYVEDLTPYLGKARVFVAPLRYGAGVKGKIVMGMSYGVPVVTTTVGSEGLGVANGEECLIADDPEQFAHAVVKLYTNHRMWEKLSENGMKLVKRNFSEPVVKAKMVDIIGLEQCSVCGNLCKLPPLNVDNMRETVVCQNCGAIKRNLDVAKVLLRVTGSSASHLWDSLTDLKKLRIYLLESCGAIYNVLSKSENSICSEFWYDVPRGTCVGNIRCEDVQNLTFPDESFDIVIAQDVFEHVPDPERGFREIWRVLKTGGYHILTAPYSRSLVKSVTRATIKESSISHILPPVYHGINGNPNVLVFTDFGLDLPQMLASIGFEIETFEDEHPNYNGGYNIVFICRKKSAS